MIKKQDFLYRLSFNQSYQDHNNRDNKKHVNKPANSNSGDYTKEPKNY